LPGVSSAVESTTTFERRSEAKAFASAGRAANEPLAQMPISYKFPNLPKGQNTPLSGGVEDISCAFAAGTHSAADIGAI